MMRPELEVADILRDHGAGWRRANAGHVSLGQLKVMSAIERCRTAVRRTGGALCLVARLWRGGHVARCENEACRHTVIAFNSCRDRHCPKCQGGAARKWLAEREAELLEVGYFHLVFTLPAAIANIAWQNKAVVYNILFKAAAETTLTIAADPKHLGARIGITAVLHTWGSAMTHHPHIHMIVPGGGLSADGSKWISSRKRYFLPVPVPVLSPLFRRLFLTKLAAAHAEGRLHFYGGLERLASPHAFSAFVKRQRRSKWVTYAKAPFVGPKSVLAYLSRYTHRVAISNRRLIKADADGVTFKYKDYRAYGPARFRTMTLSPHEFIRRFLVHVLPKGFHRIRHYGLLANGNRSAMITRARELLAMASRGKESEEAQTAKSTTAPEPISCCCPRCGSRMIVIEVFARGCAPHHYPPLMPRIRFDTS
jgi:hypothetical protein